MKFLLSLILAVSILQLGASLERKNYLKCGEALQANEWIQSTNGYYALLQSDCNFVIYASEHFAPRNVIWQSKTSRNNCKNPRLVNQNDGNLVIYSDNKGIWSTATKKSGLNCYKLIMQQDGNLVLYNAKGTAVWNSKTAA